VPELNLVVPAVLDRALKDEMTRTGASASSIVAAALAEYFHTPLHTLFQVSTSGALVEGVYTGAISSEVILKHGNFGLGTFENLDGEMVIVDGAIHQVHSDGSVILRRDDFRIPFAVITRFQHDEAFGTGPIGRLKDLEQACDPHRESPNLFYALRVEGRFEKVHARAVGGVVTGTRLVDATKKQGEFEFHNIEGTLVCIWSPSYSSAFNIPGYHFHFISKDRTKGGHVLDLKAATVRVGIQMLCEYDVRLPDEGAFLTADLSRNPASDLAQTE
jgi:acetolactate decarboxylase